MPSVTSTLILLPFFTVALHGSGIRKALLAVLLNNTEVYMTHLLVLKITQLQDKILYTTFDVVQKCNVHEFCCTTVM